MTENWNNYHSSISILHIDGNYTKTDCQDGSVRLEDGHNSLEGRIEVCYDKVWGKVCRSNLNGNYYGYGDKICQQLGYQSSG